MKDIGLGILDPYTVTIVLITLVLSQVLFGYQIPLDTSSAAQLFVSLVLFTGYVYAARSLLRLPVAAIRALVGNRELIDAIKMLNPLNITGWSDLLYWIQYVFWSIIAAPFVILWLLAVVADFAEDKYFSVNRSIKVRALTDKAWLRIPLNFLDRLSVVAIAWIAVLPQNQDFVGLVGVIGVIFMVLIYLFKGNFSALVEDSLSKVQNKQTVKEEVQLIQKESENQILRWGGIPVNASKCLVCGKINTEDEHGRLPKLCSLECFQKWVLQWDKDWCIGNGEHRQLISSLRSKGYPDSIAAENVVDRLREMGDEQSLWTLIGIIRDCSGITGHSTFTASQIISSVQNAIDHFVKEERFSLDILSKCLLDENPSVISAVADAMVKSSLSALENKINIEHVRDLLRMENRIVRYSAIQILGRVNNYSPLLQRLGRGNDSKEESAKILDAISQMEKSNAIRALKYAQHHKWAWVRSEATHILKEKFDVNSPEPDMAEDRIQCIRCGAEFTVEIPKDRDTLVFMPGFSWLFYSRSSRKFEQCPSCHKKIVVAYTKRLMSESERLSEQADINKREAPYYTEENEFKKTPPA